MSESNMNSEFYEDAGDPLAAFRKVYRGAVVGKNGEDPFKNDPDVAQSVREDKLREDERSNRAGY